MNGAIHGEDKPLPASEYGQRLLPVELDKIARIDPDLNRTAHWLQGELGKPEDFDTIAYLAAPDVRDVLLALAAGKFGFKLLLLSPRNSIQGNKHLCESTKCNTLVTTDPPAPFAQALLGHSSLKTIHDPSLRQLLAEDEVSLYPFTKSFVEAKNDPALVLHTSGSTAHANISCMIVPPSILEDIGKDPELSHALRNVPNVISSGGALPKETGEKLKYITYLSTYIGSTEITMIPHWTNEDPYDWQYLAIDPCSGIQFYPQADDLYEAVVVRRIDLEKYQPVWHVFPDLQEYHTRDLYSRHPTKPGLWMYRGRKDDIIVFVNGEKFNPVSFEDQAALLVEPKDSLHTTAEKAYMLEQIWPLIEKANDESPTHCRISKSHVLFTKAEKPISRASKGTVQRRMTLSAYADEIDALYADVESMKPAHLTPTVNDFDIHALAPVILRLVRVTCKNSIGLEDDFFFNGGMDSLQVLQLIRELGTYGFSSGDKFGALSPSLVYSHPTASSLAVAIRELKVLSQEHVVRSSTAKIEEMQHMLAEQQSKINAARGITTDLDPNKVELYQANLAAPFLGLEEPIFEKISTVVTKVIHCAWPVDFNLSLQSFSPQLQGVRALIDLSASRENSKSIFFISSIASVGNWSAVEPVPEHPQSDFSLPSSTGYAESKFLAEQLLLGSSSLIDLSICRVGQIAGPVLSDKRAWNKDEWLPSLIESSEHLSLLPDSLSSSMTDLDWIPIDILSSILIELALLPRKGSARVYHAVNPRTYEWKDLLPTVMDRLDGEKMKLISYGEWVDALRKSAAETFKKQDFGKNPAMKLLDFFEQLPSTKLPRLSTAETQKRSKTLREMQAIEAGDMGRWMQQWGFGAAENPKM
ncbi:MAG: hypothetical protein Q9170_006531 [Blastenia crenularia]